MMHRVRSIVASSQYPDGGWRSRGSADSVGCHEHCSTGDSQRQYPLVCSWHLRGRCSLCIGMKLVSLITLVLVMPTLSNARAAGEPERATPSADPVGAPVISLDGNDQGRVFDGIGGLSATLFI